MSQKQCTHCEQFKDAEKFSSHPYTQDGLQSWCKKCTLWAGRRYRRLNAERINAARREANARRKLARLTPVLTNPGTVE